MSQEPISSLVTRRLLIVCGILLVVVAVFTLGVRVGERKARHFSGWYENYGRMLPPPRGFERDKRASMRPPMPSGHGVFGKIISISGNSLVIQGKEGIEQNVIVTSSTTIRIGNEDIRPENLPTTLPNTDAAVFGAPNAQGQIEALLIRLFTHR